MSNSDDEKGDLLRELEKESAFRESAQRIIEDADGAEALQAFEAVRKSVHGVAKGAQGALDAIRPVLAQLREEAENHHSQLLGLGGSIMAHNLLREAGYLPHGVERLSLADAIDRTIYDHALALLRDKESRGEQPDGATPPSDAVQRAWAIAIKHLAKFIEDHLSTVEGRYWRVLRLIVNLERHTEPEGVFYKYVNHVLEEAGADDVSDEYRDRLARELFTAVKRLIARFIEGHGNQPDDAPDMWGVDGMLWLDAVAIDWLESEGWDGWRTDPDGARESARERWESESSAGELFALWVYPGESMPWKLKPVAWLCEYLWETELRERWERASKNRPAIIMPVHNTVEEMAWKPGGRTVKQNGSQLHLFDDEDQLLATTPFLPGDRLATIIEAGAEDLGSITAVRLFVYLVRTVFHQWTDEQHDFRVVDVEGGIQGLADAIGEKSGRARAKLKKILQAGLHWHVDWPGGEAGGLWTYRYDDTSGSHKGARLRIVLGDPLLPGYTFKKRRQILVPVVEPAPLVSSPRTYRNQAVFQQVLVREIVERRKDIARFGGARLELQDLWQIAKRVGLTRNTMGKAMGRYLVDGDDGPAFLEEVDTDQYHLADNEKYGKARRFIDETARRSAKGRKMGKVSARKRKQRKDES